MADTWRSMSSSGLGRLPRPCPGARPRSRMSRNMDSSSGVISGSSTPSRRCPGSGRVRISSGFSSVLMPLAACGRHARCLWDLPQPCWTVSGVTLQSFDTACSTPRCVKRSGGLARCVQEAVGGQAAASQVFLSAGLIMMSWPEGHAQSRVCLAVDTRTPPGVTTSQQGGQSYCKPAGGRRQGAPWRQ